MYDSMLFFGLNVPTNISYNYRLQWLNFIDIFCQVCFILINCPCSFIVMYACRGLIIKIIVDCGLLLLTACYHEIEHTIKLPNEAIDFDIFSIPATYPLAPEIYETIVFVHQATLDELGQWNFLFILWIRKWGMAKYLLFGLYIANSHRCRRIKLWKSDSGFCIYINFKYTMSTVTELELRKVHGRKQILR